MKPENQEPSPREKVEQLIDHTRDYIDTRYELLMLKATDKLSSASSILITYLILMIIFALVLILLSIGAAIWIGRSLGDGFSGFFIVSGIYLVAGIVLLATKSRWLKKPIADKIIDEMLNN